jgi:origin recognition complex subunit 5
MILITTTIPHPAFLHSPGAPHIYFPTYEKNQSIHILSTCYPLALPSTEDFTAEDSTFVYTRYLSVLWDTYIKTCSRSLSTFRHISNTLWPAFTSPIVEGHYGPRDFSKLLLHHRNLLSHDTILNPTIIPRKDTDSKAAMSLPPQLQKILTAAYLASYLPTATDLQKFSKFHPMSKKRKAKGGISKQQLLSRSRKIPRYLLPPSAFTLDRLISILSSISMKPVSSNADIHTAISTLSSLKLLIRTPVGGTGGGDLLDAGTKYRVDISLEVARAMGRRWGVEIEEYLELS